MRELSFEPAARRDLIDIYAYVAERDASAAIRLTDRLRGIAETLTSFPSRYPLVEECGEGVRKASVAGYAIFHRVTETAILIARVLHGRRDWSVLEF